MFTIKQTTAFSNAHKRGENQDRCFYMNYIGAPDRRDSISIMAVLDGVSRANGGQASAMAEAAMRPVLAELMGRCRDFRGLDFQTLKAELFRSLRNAILAADQALRAEQFGGMVYGTTITMAVVYGDRVYAANVGDSPAYLGPVAPGGGGDPIPLFECQNQAGEVVRQGLMTMEEANARKLQNRLMTMAGGDLLMEDEIFTASTWLRQSNVLLLGSDGALAVMPPAQLARVVRQRIGQGLEAVVEGIFELVQNSPSTDNATILAQWLE